MNSNYGFESQFRNAFTDFINEKRGLGFTYVPELNSLLRFDRYIIDSGYDGMTITRELFETASARKPYESERTYETRKYTYRQFCKYYVRVGGKAWYPQTIHKGNNVKRYRPHIYTDDELRRFMDAAKQMPGNEHRKLLFPMFFELLICTGMRMREAADLKKKDLEFISDIALISIRKAKFDKQRKIPVGPEFTVSLKEYLNKSQLCFPNTEYLFPSGLGKPYSSHELYITFRRLLWAAGISHGGKQYGPRLHDFRHSFAVKSLRKLVLSGEDIRAVIPLLCQYLGHEDISSTQTYLQFTADMFPYVVEKMESSLGDVVPGRECV